MHKLIQRTVGICVIFTVLTATTWSGYHFYRITFRGEKQFVVMPEGTAGVVPGSTVQYEGLVVGEVTNTTPLVHTSPKKRKQAANAIHQKRKLFEADKRDMDVNPPEKMALITFLLKEPSIPVGPRTYASGSAYYITGQGYITLKNRYPAQNSDRSPTFIPSSVRMYWMESYVNMALSIAPYFKQISKFHNRFQNWYHTSEKSGNTNETTSGRKRLRAVPETINSWNQQARTLDRQLTDVEEAVKSVHSTVEQAMDALPDSRMDQEWRRNVNIKNQSVKEQLGVIQNQFRNEILSTRYEFESLESHVQSIENDTLQEGLVD